MKRWSHHLHVLLICMFAVLMVAGCERPHSDMGQQDKYSTYDPSSFSPNGASARTLPPGVVPRYELNLGLPSHPESTNIAVATDVVTLETANPLPITADLLRRGGEQFNIFCSVCHGRLGNGEGMIVQRGLSQPPSFHVQRLKDAPDAHFYNVISNGFGAMFSYNDRIPPQRRWEIVAYIRALQSAPDAEASHISDTDRAALIAGGDRKTPTTGGGG